MIVVADTTPLHYLVLIGAVDVLEPLFTRVLVPRAVVEELERPRRLTPSKLGSRSRRAGLKSGRIRLLTLPWSSSTPAKGQPWRWLSCCGLTESSSMTGPVAWRPSVGTYA